MPPLTVPAVVASHLTSEPNTVIGFVFLGIVASLVFLLVSSVDERRAVWMVGTGWVVGIGGLLLL